MPNTYANKPIIDPGGPKRRRPPKPGEATALMLASLVEPAPLTLRCMACRTARCATATGVVLWHPDELDPKYDCAGAGAPGLPLEDAA